MARSRNIKPGFFKNEYLGSISPYARLLFIGLWLLADREGRLEDRPLKIKAEIFPFENVDIDELLETLDKCGGDLITRYETDGIRCIQINNFLEHQNPHKKEKGSCLPLPLEKSPEKARPSPVKTGTSPEKAQTSPADSLLLIPDSLIPINNVEFSLDDTKKQNKFSDDSLEVILSKYLYEKMLNNDPKARKPNFQSWATNMDKLMRIDKRTEQEIRTVIDYCQDSQFWKSNILSTAKLREKFTQLLLQAEGDRIGHYQRNNGHSKPSKAGYRPSEVDWENEPDTL